MADLAGKPVISWSAQSLASISATARIAVTSSPAVASLLTGYEICDVGAEVPSQSHSLKLGLARAKTYAPDRVLVVLGDMPFVTSSHLARLVDTCASARQAAATAYGGKPGVPACFRAADLDRLENLSEDRGARAQLLDLGAAVVAPDADWHVMDIDTPDDLERAQAYAAKAEMASSSRSS